MNNLQLAAIQRIAYIFGKLEVISVESEVHLVDKSLDAYIEWGRSMEKDIANALKSGCNTSTNS